MSRSMRLLRTLSLLAWVLIQGFTSALRGPLELTTFLGWPLSLGCQYEEGFRTHKKYWCKGPSWSSCTVVVQTDGTEAEAKAGRTSIQDNHSRLEFTVRLENVSQEDAGIYWCGIQRSWYDPGFQIKITALPGFTSALRGPPELSAVLGWPLSLGCQYEEGFRTHKKYWCKGPSWSSCIYVVQTDGTEAEAKVGRTSIQDNHSRLEFTVRLSNVSQEDAGIYWCGIEQVGYDPGFQIQITALPDQLVQGVTSGSQRVPRINTTRGLANWKDDVIESTGVEVPRRGTQIAELETASVTAEPEMTTVAAQMYSTTGTTDIVSNPTETLPTFLPTTELSGIHPSETTEEVLYQVSVPFLISTGLKTAILLGLIFGIIRMRRSDRQRSEAQT